MISSVTIGTNVFATVRGLNGAPQAGTNLYASTVVTNNWPAFRTLPSAASLVLPLTTNYLFLTNSDYSFSKNQFVYPGIASGDLANNFPIPDWRVRLGTRLRVVLVDTSVSPGRIIDYVNLSAYQDPINVPFELQNGATCDGSWNGQIADLFCTNRLGNPRKASSAIIRSVISTAIPPTKRRPPASKGNLKTQKYLTWSPGAGTLS